MRKWKYNPKSAIVWWESLSIDDKVDYKNRFEIFRNSEEVAKSIWPNMYDLRHIRISQLSHKHITRVWVFKDKI